MSEDLIGDSSLLSDDDEEPITAQKVSESILNHHLRVIALFN